MEIISTDVLNMFKDEMHNKGSNKNNVYLNIEDLNERLEGKGKTININNLQKTINDCVDCEYLKKVSLNGKLKITSEGLNFLNNEWNRSQGGTQERSDE